MNTTATFPMQPIEVSAEFTREVKYWVTVEIPPGVTYYPQEQLVQPSGGGAKWTLQAAARAGIVRVKEVERKAKR